MTTAPEVAVLARDGQWFAHRYDPEQDSVHLLHLSRATHRDATFLTDSYLPAALPKVIVDRQALFDATPKPPAPQFIFHSAFCCSTLLVRAFDLPGLSMGLKEPPIYNDIAGWRHRGAAPARVARLCDQATTLVSRPLAPGEVAVIKPSNVANGFARVLLAMHAHSRAVLLYAPLAIYLKSVAKKGIDGRLWVRDLLIKLRRDGLVDLGFTIEDHLGQTDLQVAAVGWLAQQALFGRLIGEFGNRVATLDSEVLLTDPRGVLAALGTLFGLPLDEAQIDGIVKGPAFTRHSKDGSRFGRDLRATEYAEADARHGDEIAKVIVWAEEVAKRAGVPMAPPGALLHVNC